MVQIHKGTKQNAPSQEESAVRVANFAFSSWAAFPSAALPEAGEAADTGALAGGGEVGTPVALGDAAGEGGAAWLPELAETGAFGTWVMSTNC